jgi:Ca2+-binding EF-hand superfamily protein
MFQSQNKPYDEHQLDEFIKAADTNRDGLIQRKELYALYKKIGKPLRGK